MKDSKIKTIAKVVSIVLIVLLLAAVVGVVFKFTNGFTDDFKIFYVEHDGKVLATTDKVALRRGETAAFNVKYTFDSEDSEARDFTVQVVSYADTKTAFNYTVSGTNYGYKNDMDLTEAFALEQGERGFTLTVPCTMQDVLKSYHDGKAVELKEPDMKANAYFKIIVTPYNGKSPITLSLYLHEPAVGDVELDKDTIIFEGTEEIFSISYVVDCAFERPGNDSQWRIVFECQETAKVGEKVTFIFKPNADNGWLESVGVYAGASLIASFSETDSWQPCTFTMPASDVVVRFVIE